MIGPQVPGRSTSDDDDDSVEAGPSLPVGPIIPADILAKPAPPVIEDEDDEDDYAPALPPDLAATRGAPGPSTGSRQVQGPAFPPSFSTRTDDSDDEDDYGPKPLPSGISAQETDGVREFLEKEERRRKLVEVRQPLYRTLRPFEVVKVVFILGSIEAQGSQA